MAVIKVTFTEDLLKLVANIRFTQVPDMESEKDKMTWGLDFFSLYGGNLTFEDIAYILGRYDEHIPGTEEDPMGAKFSQELEDYMWGMHTYILDNIGNIEEIIHQFAAKGGVTPGTYKCKSYEHIWEREENN